MKISIGKSRKDTHWKVVNWSWDKLCDRLSTPVRTSETMADYKSMSKDDKAMRKDVGGFVGGEVTGGRRVRSNVANRSIITLDADFAEVGIWDRVTLLLGYTICCYSTHSHTPKAPRLRFVLPLDREVTPEEYEPIARYVAKEIGINQFDVTTYDVSRLMFWPSVSSDGEFIFERVDGEPVKADEILGKYNDWHDTNEWPIGDTEVRVKTKQAKQQGDPTTKSGIVGAFCQVYDVPSAIDTFLADVYVPCNIPNRYTYTGGSTAAGVVLYQDGKFAYSHHATDPAGGQLCNAFDLVRIHKFGVLDGDIDPDTPITKYPSYKAMQEFATEDEAVKAHIVGKRLQEAQAVFSEPLPSDWTKELNINKSGNIEPTIENYALILNNDPNLKDTLAMNEFVGKLRVVGNLPWRKCKDKVNGDGWKDSDESSLRLYVERTYGAVNRNNLTDALNHIAQEKSFHPVRQYLNGLSWDEVPRAETLFADVLGAKNSAYTRAVTRKWLLGAVARIMRPGCKFDNMVVLVGAQGIGKSTLGNKLGRCWFSDTVIAMQGKEAYEQLQGHWIIEMGELATMKKAEVETVKSFISKREDSFRAAYARNSQDNPRQCVFYGTTNTDNFLRDSTGNRRFWPIGCEPKKASRSVFSLTDYDIDQIWAEVMTWYKSGESLTLPAEVADDVITQQEAYTIEDPRVSEVTEYLSKEIPVNWDKLGKKERRDFIQGFLETDKPLKERTQVSIVEIGYELYGEESLDMPDVMRLHDVMRRIKNWHKREGRQRMGPYGVQTIYGKGEE